MYVVSFDERIKVVYTEGLPTLRELDVSIFI